MKQIEEYYNSLSDFKKERFNECKAKAEAFFATKDRRKFYRVAGYDSYSEDNKDIEIVIWLYLSDEKVEELKTYLIEEYHKFEPDDPCHNWEDFMNTDPSLAVPFFEAMNEKAGPWDKLVASAVERSAIIPTGINFDNYLTCYHASYFEYDKEENKFKGPYQFNISLTDEQYILLLTLQLFEERGLTFNRLFDIAPDLFRHIYNIVESIFADPRIPDQWFYETYSIVLDEIVSDAKEITLALNNE